MPYLDPKYHYVLTEDGLISKKFDTLEMAAAFWKQYVMDHIKYDLRIKGYTQNVTTYILIDTEHNKKIADNFGIYDPKFAGLLNKNLHYDESQEKTKQVLQANRERALTYLEKIYHGKVLKTPVGLYIDLKDKHLSDENFFKELANIKNGLLRINIRVKDVKAEKRNGAVVLLESKIVKEDFSKSPIYKLSALASMFGYGKVKIEDNNVLVDLSSMGKEFGNNLNLYNKLNTIKNMLTSIGIKTKEIVNKGNYKFLVVTEGKKMMSENLKSIIKSLKLNDIVEIELKNPSSYKYGRIIQFRDDYIKLQHVSGIIKIPINNIKVIRIEENIGKPLRTIYKENKMLKNKKLLKESLKIDVEENDEYYVFNTEVFGDAITLKVDKITVEKLGQNYVQASFKYGIKIGYNKLMKPDQNEKEVAKHFGNSLMYAKVQNGIMDLESKYGVHIIVKAVTVSESKKNVNEGNYDFIDDMMKQINSLNKNEEPSGYDVVRVIAKSTDESLKKYLESKNYLLHRGYYKLAKPPYFYYAPSEGGTHLIYNLQIKNSNEAKKNAFKIVDILKKHSIHAWVEYKGSPKGWKKISNKGIEESKKVNENEQKLRSYIRNEVKKIVKENNYKLNELQLEDFIGKNPSFVQNSVFYHENKKIIEWLVEEGYYYKNKENYFKLTPKGQVIERKYRKYPNS